MLFNHSVLGKFQHKRNARSLFMGSLGCRELNVQTWESCK